MVHGYHLILPMYGFWLPNDPRGSWSQVVRKWELLHFGEASWSCDRTELLELSEEEQSQREEAKRRLKYPPVSISGKQAQEVGRGFKKRVEKSGYHIWACAILPEHTHLVIARHHFVVEKIAVQLKSAATRELVEQGCHPLESFARSGKRPPRMWAEHHWKVFLDSDEAIENAINYVLKNPEKEGKPRQNWSFVEPFRGVEGGGMTTYH
jgi:REP element-mobilizing transposase RayT